MAQRNKCSWQRRDVGGHVRMTAVQLALTLPPQSQRVRKIMIKIVIADDHGLIREGLKKVVLAESDIEIAGEAQAIQGVFDLLANTSVDVLVLDLSLDGYPEIQALLAVRAQFPATQVLVLSIHPEERFAVAALKAGAAGYVCKARTVEEVVAAIRKISSGGRHVNPLVAELLAEELTNPADLPGHRRLTRRESEVLCLLGRGLAIKQVAAQLGLSVSSVNTYRTRIFDKMGLRTNAELIRYVLERELSA
jgi:DNA-binding NarL/FixJ family response regulator